MKTSTLLAALAILVIAPSRSDAQQMKLQIQNGLVTLEAQNVSVRQILAEWARVGGAKIVNAEKVTGSPVTLHLTGVPERQAIDTVLRGVSGYMLAPRPATMAGVSSFDRILILPTSSAPRNPAPVNAGFQGSRPMPMPVQAEPVETDIVEEDGDNDEPEPENEGGEEVVQPQPGMNQRFQQRPGFPMGQQGQPFTPGNLPGAPQQIDDEGQVQPQPGQAPTPGNPFGLPAGASSTPGVISPVPQQDPNQPQRRRPPQPPV
jgi:hypothetical protein